MAAKRSLPLGKTIFTGDGQHIGENDLLSDNDPTPRKAAKVDLLVEVTEPEHQPGHPANPRESAPGMIDTTIPDTVVTTDQVMGGHHPLVLSSARE